MPWARGRPRSAEYGAAHAAEARRRKATLTEQDLCGYCDQPLGPSQTVDPYTGRRIGLWHLPHSADRTHYLPGMWHKACNEREAAIRARAMQDVTQLSW